MKYIINFTLVGDDTWYTTSDECELYNTAQLDERLAELTNMKIHECNIKGKVKRAIAFSENFELIAYSNDVRELNNLTIVKNNLLK